MAAIEKNTENSLNWSIFLYILIFIWTRWRQWFYGAEFVSLPHFTSAFLSPADKTSAGSTYFVPERECFSPIFPLSYRRFMMKSYCVSSLDSFRKDQIQTMVNTCTAHDHTSLSFPFEDASLFLFSECDGRIVSAIAFVPVDDLCLLYTSDAADE